MPIHPVPIKFLHESNRDHIALVRALRAGNHCGAMEVSRRHVDVLHKTMFMGLAGGAGQAGTAELISAGAWSKTVYYTSDTISFRRRVLSSYRPACRSPVVVRSL
jgi:hypothetical protein